MTWNPKNPKLNFPPRSGLRKTLSKRRPHAQARAMWSAFHPVVFGLPEKP
jgi:hypothetical protein